MKDTQSPSWRFRPAVKDDVDGVCEVIHAYSLHLVGVGLDVKQAVISTWEQPGFDPRTDTCVAVSADGTIVGYAEVEDTEPPHVKLHGWLRVHPTLGGDELNAALLSWVEARAVQSISKAPHDARVGLQLSFPNEDSEMASLLQDSGFAAIRHFWRMTIELAQDVPAPDWPDAITVRAFDLKHDLTPLVHAIRDSFKDHWGHVDKPFDEELAYWDHRFRGNPEFDPTLLFLAEVGGQIVGYSVCEPKHPEDEAMGVVGVLGVLRAWRRRGLGLALLRHSFRELKVRDRHRVCLGVDATSLTGANKLYEAAGMTPTRQFDVYEKEIRPGVDLTLRELKCDEATS